MNKPAPTAQQLHKPRGLAAMTPERRKQIASMGGKASPSNFKYSKERASAAGKKRKGEAI